MIIAVSAIDRRTVRGRLARLVLAALASGLISPLRGDRLLCTLRVWM